MATIPRIHRFNVGGKRYEVSQLLLEQQPHTMLARLVSETWNQGKAEEIFIERDGERFRYVLDFLRDGKVELPISADPKANIVAELVYFGIDCGDASSIQHIADRPAQYLSQLLESLNEVRDTINKSLAAANERRVASQAEIRKIDDEIDSIKFARFCVERHVSGNAHCDFSKQFARGLTTEQASVALAPFGFRCITLTKENFDSHIAKVEIEALSDSP